MIQNFRKPVLISAGFLLLVQCQTTDQDLGAGSVPAYKPETYHSAAYTEHEARKEVESFRPKVKRAGNPFDLEPWADRPEVERWIKLFTGTGKERFIRHLRRGEAMRPLIESILNDKGLPTDLYYLALIESGFRPEAHSHKSAVGIWQFIQGTGKRYGLRSNYYVDERRDPIRATLAASGYLSDLYRVFQSWFLAFAAYHAGEGRVLNAIMRHETRNYWALIEKKGLPPETRNYVPKFIAAAWVARNPEKYGLPVIEEEPYPELQGVNVPGGVSLRAVGEVTGIEVSQIQDLNPHLLRGVVPPGGSSYSLWLPRDRISQDTELALVRLKPGPTTKVASEKDGHYRVRRGDSLYSIAKKFNSSVFAIKKANNLSSNRLAAGRTLTIPGLSANSLTAGAKEAEKQVYYTVRRGDSLYSIAQYHRTDVSRLKRLNNLRSNSIKPGQKLLLAGTPPAGGHTQSAKSVKTYRVRRGDTLASIARKFSVTIAELKNKNSLRGNRIYEGQILDV